MYCSSGLDGNEFPRREIYFTSAEKPGKGHVFQTFFVVFSTRSIHEGWIRTQIILLANTESEGIDRHSE